MPSALLPRVLVTLSLAVSVVLLGSVPAFAGVPTVSRNPSPGPGYSYGVPWSSFPTSLQPLTAASGWSVRDIVADGTSAAADRSSPSLFTLSEPWNDNGNLVVSVLGTAIIDNGSTVVQSEITIGAASGLSTPFVQCQPDEWNLSQTRTDTSSTTGALIRNGNPPYYDHTPMSKWYPATNPYWCPSVVSFTTQIRVRRFATVTPVVVTATWSAEAYVTGHALPLGNAASLICAATGYDQALALAGCKDVSIDLPLDHYCDGAPAIDILNPPTFARAIAFYADCLFHPRSGFDRHGDLSSAMAASALGQITYQVGSVGDAYKFASSCGNLGGPITSGSFRSFTLDTCSWSGWAPKMKLALGAFIVLGFAWWVIDFVVNVVLSIFAIKTPSPVGKDGAK